MGFGAAIVCAVFACSSGDAADGPVDCVSDTGVACKDGATCAIDHCGTCWCQHGTIECEAEGFGGGGSCGPYDGGISFGWDSAPPTPANAIAVGIDAVALAVGATDLYWLDSSGSLFHLPKNGGTIAHVPTPLAADFAIVDGGFALLALNAPYPPYLVRANGVDGGFVSFPYPDDLASSTGALRAPLRVTDDRAVVSTENGGLGVLAFGDGGWSAAQIADGGSTRIVGESADEIATVVAGSPPELVVVDRTTLVPERVVPLESGALTFAFDDAGTTFTTAETPTSNRFDGGIERIDVDGATSFFPVPATPGAMTTDDTYLYAVGWNLYAIRKDDAGVLRLDGDGGHYASFFEHMLVATDDDSIFVYASDGPTGVLYRFAKPPR